MAGPVTALPANSSLASNALMRSVSLRKASCPYGERSTRKRPRPAKPSIKATASSIGTKRSPSTAITDTGTPTCAGSTRCKSIDSDKRNHAVADTRATNLAPAASK